MALIRIEPSDVETVLLDGAWAEAERDVVGSVAAGQIMVGDLVLDPTAEPPFDKFLALCEKEARFRQSWDRKRKDLKDSSPSAYDMALADHAVKDGWSDQEVVDLLVAARRRFGDELKLREGYFALTIRKARQSLSDASATIRLLNALDEPPAASDGDVTNSTGGQDAAPVVDRLAIVSDLLKVKITRFVQYRADPPQYRLETEDGSVTLGEASAVLSLSRFRAAVFAATQRVIPRFKDPQWDKVVQALGEALIVESIGEEATEQGIARAWVTAYLSKHPPLDDPGEALVGNLSFTKDDRIYIWGERLQQFLATSYFDRVTPREMGAALRVLGATPVKVNARIGGENDARAKRVNRNAWRLPDEWQPDSEDEP